jgi:hypothetical protein
MKVPRAIPFFNSSAAAWQTGEKDEKQTSRRKKNPKTMNVLDILKYILSIGSSPLLQNSSSPPKINPLADSRSQPPSRAFWPVRGKLYSNIT